MLSASKLWKAIDAALLDANSSSRSLNFNGAGTIASALAQLAAGV
jgi:hypothetical protein